MEAWSKKSSPEAGNLDLNAGTACVLEIKSAEKMDKNWNVVNGMK